MKNHNKLFIATGYEAAKMAASAHCKSVRPGGKKIHPRPVVFWKDASEEMKKDPKVLWIDGLIGKRTFRKHTKEEKEEIRLNKMYHLEQMFDYILKNYGIEYASIFAKENEKEEITFNLNIPYCKYNQENQCDMFCPFFKKECIWEKKNEN